MTTTETIRKIIRIDEEKCNGCGACVPACAEGALHFSHFHQLVSCLPDEFDEEAVKLHLEEEKPNGRASLRLFLDYSYPV